MYLPLSSNNILMTTDVKKVLELKTDFKSEWEWQDYYAWLIQKFRSENPYRLRKQKRELRKPIFEKFITKRVKWK